MWVTKDGQQQLINDGTFPYWKSLGWSEWEGPGTLQTVSLANEAAYTALVAAGQARADTLYVWPTP